MTDISSVPKMISLGLDSRGSFIQQNDPKGYFHQSGFKIGVFDVDADGKKDSNEAVLMFKEVLINNRVYVIAFEKALGNNQWAPRLFAKSADGKLSAVALTGNAAATVTIKKPGDLAAAVERIQKSVVDIQPPKVSGGGSAKGELYAGWTSREGINDGQVKGNPWTHNSSDQGTQNNTSGGSRGGFGGGMVGVWEENKVGSNKKPWTSSSPEGSTGWRHYVSSYEAYERFLAGSTAEQDADPLSYAANDGRSSGTFKDWARGQGLTIHNDLVVDGKDVMGFTFEKEGVKITMYWDLESQSHKVAKASKLIDGTQIDVTTALIVALGDTQFGKNWQDIQEKLTIPPDLKPLDPSDNAAKSIQEYGSTFDANDKRGSALETTEEENQAYLVFLSDWSVLRGEGTGVKLPASEEERKRLLAAMLKLNPRHMLEFLCGGIPGDVSGFDILTQLIRQTDVSPDEMRKIALQLGKVAHLCGYGIAQGGEDADKYLDLSILLGQSVESLLAKAKGAGISSPQIESIAKSLCAGFLNKDVDSPGLPSDPVAAVGEFYRQLAIYAKCETAEHGAADASRLVTFTERLMESLGSFVAERQLEGVDPDNGAIDANMKVMIVAAVVQKLSAAALGVLFSATNDQSKSARDVYEAKIKEIAEVYQNIYNNVNETTRDILQKFSTALEKLI